MRSKARSAMFRRPPAGACSIVHVLSSFNACHAMYMIYIEIEKQNRKIDRRLMIDTAVSAVIAVILPLYMSLYHYCRFLSCFSYTCCFSLSLLSLPLSASHIYRQIAIYDTTHFIAVTVTSPTDISYSYARRKIDDVAKGMQKTPHRPTRTQPTRWPAYGRHAEGKWRKCPPSCRVHACRCTYD